MGNIKFEPRHLEIHHVHPLELHYNAFDTRTSFMYDRQPQTLHYPAKERMKKERMKIVVSNIQNPPSEA
jgi:hypothetical protein